MHYLELFPTRRGRVPGVHHGGESPRRWTVAPGSWGRRCSHRWAWRSHVDRSRARGSHVGRSRDHGSRSRVNGSHVGRSRARRRGTIGGTGKWSRGPRPIHGSLRESRLFPLTDNAVLLWYPSGRRPPGDVKRLRVGQLPALAWRLRCQRLGSIEARLGSRRCD